MRNHVEDSLRQVAVLGAPVPNPNRVEHDCLGRIHGAGPPTPAKWREEPAQADEVPAAKRLNDDGPAARANQLETDATLDDYEKVVGYFIFLEKDLPFVVQPINGRRLEEFDFLLVEVSE
jgi:hypothetical protein